MLEIFSFGLKSYHYDYHALGNISFEILRGESIGILGRNGAGKSTLLKILSGVMSPSSGSFRVEGRIAALLELGAGFNPDLTGRQNIFFQGALQGFEAADMEFKVEEIVRFANIGDYIDQPVKSYSSGMFARLAFSIAINVEPDLLIIDEALSVGDAIFQKKCYRKMQELLESGVSLIVVSHSEEVIRTLTQKALVLNRGQLSFYGTSADALLEYRRQISEAENQSTKHVEASGLVGSDKSNSSAKEFGTKSVTVTSLEITNSEGEVKELFFPLEKIKITIKCKVYEDIENLNVSLRIRNKEGLKVYSWGTLNQDMIQGGETFWSRKFSEGECFSVDFLFDCRLGPNLYEVQAAVTQEKTMDYRNQVMLHWIDEAGHFSAGSLPHDYFYGGAFDLQMVAKW